MDFQKSRAHHRTVLLAGKRISSLLESGTPRKGRELCSRAHLSDWEPKVWLSEDDYLDGDNLSNASDLGGCIHFIDFYISIYSSCTS